MLVSRARVPVQAKGTVNNERERERDSLRYEAVLYVIAAPWYLSDPPPRRISQQASKH